MRPDVEDALIEWESAFKDQQNLAVRASMVAFPFLRPLPYPTGCCELRMEWRENGLGEGTVCVDEQARGSIEFTGMPHQPVGEAIDKLTSKGWFEDAPDGIAAAGPGTYWWNDEDHGGEWEFKVNAEGRVDMSMDFMRIPDIIAVLDTLHTALTAQ